MAVAYYPGCDPREPSWAPLETDTLIRMDGADDRTPAPRCARWRDAVQTNRHVLQTLPARSRSSRTPSLRPLPAIMLARIRSRWVRPEWRPEVLRRAADLETGNPSKTPAAGRAVSRLTGGQRFELSVLFA